MVEPLRQWPLEGARMRGQEGRHCDIRPQSIPTHVLRQCRPAPAAQPRLLLWSPSLGGYYPLRAVLNWTTNGEKLSFYHQGLCFLVLVVFPSRSCLYSRQNNVSSMVQLIILLRVCVYGSFLWSGCSSVTRLSIIILEKRISRLISNKS